MLYSGLCSVDGSEKRIGFVCDGSDPDDIIYKIANWPIFKNKELRFEKIRRGIPSFKPPGPVSKGVWWNVRPKLT